MFCVGLEKNDGYPSSVSRIYPPHINALACIYFTGPFAFKVEFYTISEAESAFEAEIKYWRGSELRSDFAHGPGSHTFTAGICGCVSRIRFRSYTLGQIIKIRLS